MKKAIFVILFVLLASAVFSLEILDEAVFNTSTESITAMLLYYGKNMGIEVSASIASQPESSVVSRLSIDQTGVVNRMLNRYQSTTGDTYWVILGLWYPGGQIIKYSIWVIIEYTSRTEYRWWGYRIGNAR